MTTTQVPTLRVVRPTDELTRAALDAVQREFDKYIVFPSNEARDACVLWTLHTHVFRAFESTPRLSVRSTEPGSGKSRVLQLVKRMTPNALDAIDMTPAVMYRSIERGATLLIDEADTIWGKGGSGSSHTQRRAVINAGHHVDGSVMRPQGQDEVRQFGVFGPMALAGIGRLPETIATRSVEIVMRKRKPGDPTVKPFRLKFASDDLAKAYEACELWAAFALKPLRASMPELPVADRAADVWEPLVAIADLTHDEEWSKRARKACKRLTQEANDKPVTIGVRLLQSIRAAFGKDEILATPELMERLYSEDESPWERGQFSSRDMARILAEYGVSSQTVRIDGHPTRGYKREAFEPAFNRYIKTEE